ncbi:MAG: alpha-amylase family protein [Ornithinimicrobium sp.]|uniref:alpha-amylase family protein n=1 Tax=Ornithinimicrobium sp. TaxID=1977084 RepID=UPI003D9B08F5
MGRVSVISTPVDLPTDLSPLHAATIESALAPLAEHRRQTFWLRVRRWWDDLLEGLQVYPDPPGVAGRVLELAATAYAARDDELHLLDERRLLEPDWFQQPGVLGYAAYAERYAAPGTGLGGVARRVDHLRDLGVTYLHLMPLLATRKPPNDGGYAVTDYRSVRPDLGTVQDLRDLASTLRAHGISLCLDLVLNHVALEHEWVQAAQRGEQRYRDYFYLYPDRTEPDAYEATLPEVFPDFAPGNFTWDDAAQSWVWTTFNDYQWDLNWANPDVLAEMADVVLHLADLGVEVLRLDAVAFIWKRKGTNCQNQPEVHQLTQALRTLAKITAPALVFKAEAIVGPGDLVHYLGRGVQHGKVSDLAYHNSLMVQIWSMLATRDVRLAAHALAQIPQIPSVTAWITYLRCHDDIGWAIDDGDAAAVQLNGFEHRGFLSRFYSAEFDGSVADGLVFQHNPTTGDTRISGTAASLAGVGSALRAQDPGRLDDAIGRLLVGHALVLGWGGVPVLWSGDEIATLNDPDWDTVPEHAGDNRWAHRPALDWSVVDTLAEQLDGPAARVCRGLAAMVRARARLPHLHAGVAAHPVPTTVPAVLGVVRLHPLGAMIGLYNMSEHRQHVPTWWVAAQGLEPHAMFDHLTGNAPAVTEHGDLRLRPYQAMWLTAR